MELLLLLLVQLLDMGNGRGARMQTGVAGTGASDCVGEGVEDEDDSEDGDESEDGDDGGEVGSFSVNRGGHRPLIPWLYLLLVLWMLLPELVLLVLAVLQPLSRLLFLLSSLWSSSLSISSSCGLNLLQLLIRKNGG